ncbi:Branched-chain amino acid transport protein (AzlD) [Grimontia celer]|uniref:Branched-chain amino acid transport protein (AzlD) n=1 Tax=Grimontia celer TaxID=1796497 RepID=A0A128F2K0_9GAMM|nr:AzlD domain-containing protein [Grimontia celer]CZF81027.1 Branched-chain amino acid transport protein (AzlD) [Grimontia celer]
MNTWLLIIGMACITFSVRYFFLAQSIPFRVTPVMQRILKYSAPAVLTALAVPILLFPQGNIDISIDNPFLLAGVFVCVLSLMRLSTLKTVVISMIFFWLIR